ncbi:CBS domain-containing protein [Streptomyces sp. NPDC001678]|uniref:CBS domain-containing protein n=1 Tax=Streptomyces sp. NPDC001678 TaxID=3364599 RepID=UPI00367E2042
MTLDQMHPRPTIPNAVQTLADPTAPAAPQVWDTMTVEVALSLMTAARVSHLVICDEDGQRTGRVTLVRLTDVRDSPDYTDRIRLRDVTGGSAPGALAVSH